MYRSLYDKKRENISTCPNLDATYWRFDGVKVDDVVGNVISPSKPAKNINNATETAAVMPNDANVHVRCSVSFDLKVRLCFIMEREREGEERERERNRERER